VATSWCWCAPCRGLSSPKVIPISRIAMVSLKNLRQDKADDPPRLIFIADRIAEQAKHGACMVLRLLESGLAVSDGRVEMGKNQQKLVAFVFGVVFLIALLTLAVAFPDPTSFQYTVFRIILSLAAAGIGALLPGVLDVNPGKWIRAGGALAVFVIVYFYSPAALVVSPDRVNDDEPNRIQPFHTPNIESLLPGTSPGGQQLLEMKYAGHSALPAGAQAKVQVAADESFHEIWTTQLIPDWQVGQVIVGFAKPDAHKGYVRIIIVDAADKLLRVSDTRPFLLDQGANP